MTWTDGPALSAVMTALAEGGVAHMRCSRTSSPLARAAVVIRQARESSLHDSTRFTALCNNLDALTQDEWLLGRQLLAFAGRTSDATALTSTLRRIGLTILADTAGLPRPTDIDCCSGCQGSPRFTIRADGSAQTLFACATCVSHYATGGFEILPLATSAIPIARAIGLLERTLVDAGGARFQVDGFSIEAGALTATLKLNPIDQYGHPTRQSWTLLSSLDGWTVD